MALGKFNLAIEDFNATLNVDNRNADGWAGLGLATKDRQPRESGELPARALVIDPNNSGRPFRREPPEGLILRLPEK